MRLFGQNYGDELSAKGKILFHGIFLNLISLILTFFYSSDLSNASEYLRT